MRLRKRVEQIDQACASTIRKVSDLTSRVARLERDSHTPLAMVTCRTCGVLVDELGYDFHVDWHDNDRERMTPDQAATFMLDHSAKPLRWSLVRVQTDVDVRRQLVEEVAETVNRRGDPRLVGRFVEAMHVLEPERLQTRAPD